MGGAGGGGTCLRGSLAGVKVSYSPALGLSMGVARGGGATGIVGGPGGGG